MDCINLFYLNSSLLLKHDIIKWHYHDDDNDNDINSLKIILENFLKATLNFIVTWFYNNWNSLSNTQTESTLYIEKIVHLIVHLIYKLLYIYIIYIYSFESFVPFFLYFLSFIMSTIKSTNLWSIDNFTYDLNEAQ